MSTAASHRASSTQSARSASKGSVARRAEAASTAGSLLQMKVRSASEALGGQAKLASFVGVDRSQPTRWADGETAPSAAVVKTVTDLEFIVARARMVWPDVVVSDWLTGHNAFLDGATPLDMIRAGRTSEVLDAIDGADAGVYA